MGALITYPDHGRGAWNYKGIGGTLSAKGDAPGKYYRSSSVGTVLAPGLVAFRADRDSAPVSIDDYSVWRAVIAIQNALKSAGVFPHTVDGIWGPLTDVCAKQYQTEAGIVADGIFGPQTAKEIFGPQVLEAAEITDSEHAADIAKIMVGTVTLESVWDPGAVGSADSHDLGFGQINGPSHPTLRPNDCLNPRMSLPWIARLIESNLMAFDFNVRDAVAAYNLGQGGTRRWISQGRPDLYTPIGSTTPRNVKAYIDKILA